MISDVRDRRSAFSLHRRIEALNLLKRHVFEFAEAGSHVIVTQIAEQHSVGREIAGCERDEDLLDPDFASDRRCVQWACATVNDHKETAGIKSPLGGHCFDGVRHRGHRDAQNSIRRLGNIEPERLGQLLLHGLLRRRSVKLHLAAEKIVRVEPSQQHVGVSHGRFGSATAITGRTWNRTGTLRANPQRITFAEARDAASAGADFENIHHRNLDRQRPLIAADQGAASRERLAVADHASFRRGPSHIERDSVFEAQLRANGLRPNDARGGPDSSMRTQSRRAWSIGKRPPVD